MHHYAGPDQEKSHPPVPKPFEAHRDNAAKPKMEKNKTFKPELIFLNHVFLNIQRIYMHVILFLG